MPNNLVRNFVRNLVRDQGAVDIDLVRQYGWRPEAPPTDDGREL
jgi:hypothetical protein